MSVHPGGAWCHRRPKAGVISPGTGVVSCHVVLGIELGSSERASSALNCGTSSLASGSSEYDLSPLCHGRTSHIASAQQHFWPLASAWYTVWGYIGRLRRSELRSDTCTKTLSGGDGGITIVDSLLPPPPPTPEWPRLRIKEQNKTDL